jgi:outer membrane protein OmpA-like peptidoglycan-associated protein
MNLQYLKSLKLVIAATCLTLVAACAPLTKVTLLPQADGSKSAVLVTSGKSEQLLTSPYQQAIGQEEKALKLDMTTAADVQKAHPQLFTAMPPKASKYILNFLPGGTNLTPESEAQLPALLADVTQRAGADLVVTGHTDTTGALAANDELSLKRAKVVAQLLVSKGAAESRIEAVGRGKRELLVPTADEVDEPKNRRVEIVVR